MIEKPGVVIFYLVPTYRKSEIIERMLVQYCSQFLTKKNLKKHKYELINGSSVSFWTAAPGHDESFYGFKCDDFILEEMREYDSEAFTKAFSRIQSSPDGRMTIASSPETNHILEDIENGMYENVEFSVHHLSPFKNVFQLYNKDNPYSYLNDAKIFYPDRKYQRDVLGNFIADAGKDFYNFFPEKHCVETPPGYDQTIAFWSSPIWLGPMWEKIKRPNIQPKETIVSIDFGATICSAVVLKIYLPFQRINDLSQFTWENTMVWVFKEYQLENTSLVDLVNKYIMPIYPPSKTIIFCDPSGKKRESTYGKTPIQYLTDLGYQVIFKHYPRIEGIDSIRSRLQIDKLFISKNKCPKLVKNMLKVESLKEESRKRISTDIHGHLPDALRYGISNLFPIRNVYTYSDEYRKVIHQSYVVK